jgi:dolichol-phosphate mannosyltransferase
MRELHRLSVVFSFRNEAAVLNELANRVIRSIDTIGCDYELIFVNDDSTDRSLEILSELAKHNERIKTITMSRRFGVHPCVLAGLRFSSGDVVIYMDADLQDPPELIPDMVEKYRQGADVVNMTRTERQGEHAAKMWLTKLAYKTINALSDIPVPENTGDFKLLSRRVVDNLLSLQESDPFMRGLVYWVGFRQDSIQYVREVRFAGKTHFSLFGSGPVKEFIRGATSFSVAPLYLSLIIGLISTAVSFVFLASILIQKILGMNLPGWTAIMSAILFIGGTLHLCFGLTGVYVGKIHIQTRNRPLYIVQHCIGTFTSPPHDKAVEGNISKC